MIETERKFLVKSDSFKSEASRRDLFIQAYLNTDPKRTVRIRIVGEKGFITVKGKSSQSGMSRYEWEKEIPVQEAKELLLLCEPGKIEKMRYLVPVNDKTFEVDEFGGDNEGLVLAEIELESEETDFDRPDWLGEEVTGNINYYNSQLISNPYKTREK